MARSRRSKRRIKKGFNWFLFFLILLFVLTFKTSSFDILPPLYINDIIFKVPEVTPTPTYIPLESELSHIEKLLEKGELLSAKDRLDRLSARGIRGGKIHYLYGILYEKMASEYREKALSEFRIGILYKGPDIQAHYELGKIYFSQRSFKEALDEFLKVKDFYKEDPVFLKYLGISYLEIGDYKNAEEVLKKTKKLAPKDEEVNNYIKRLETLLRPVIQITKTPTSLVKIESTPLSATGSRNIKLTKDQIFKYFEKYGNIKGSVHVIYQNITYKVFQDGSYKEKIYRLTFVKDPAVLQKGIEFAYNKKFTKFALYELKGFTKNGEEIDENEFNYEIEEHNTKEGLEKAIISYSASSPIILLYELEISFKSVLKDKFQIFVFPLSDSFTQEDIRFIFPQDMSFNIYPKDRVKIKDENGYKEIYFDNTEIPIIINNFLSWTDVYDYINAMCNHKSFEYNNKKDPQSLYNTFFSYYKEKAPESVCSLFIDPIYKQEKIKIENFLDAIALFDIYKNYKIQSDLGFIFKEIGFPYMSFSLKGIVYLKNEDVFIEPYPFLPYGFVLPEDTGKYAVFIGTEKKVKIPNNDDTQNIQEDYIKIRLDKEVDNLDAIFYSKGLCDYFYRKMFYENSNLKDPKIWFFASDISFSKMDSSEIKRLDIPIQVALKGNLPINFDKGKFLPPYILPSIKPAFPFTIKRRIEIDKEDYTITKVPGSISLNKGENIYKIMYNINENTHKLVITNIYICKSIKDSFDINKLTEKVKNAYIEFSK